MTKTIKIPTSKITQFESKQTPTIQQEKNIIKKDNIGTVVPGDALRNINLSTVPSVVQDAINQMALSVEAKVLANALLLQIQRDIDNLGDAIVEKSYIDGQVTYLTNIVNQKSDKGDVASIVDSKLAIVTPTLATANQVTHLSSRLDESQSSINEVKQTINTEKQALISMIEEAEAKVDENLSNYSAVLNLTVDNDGNIVSQKLESLISQNNNLRISIDELEESMLDEFGNWSAKVAKFITDNNGNITGFSFANGSGQTSKFKINADNFQISNSSNSYVPFKIEGNNLIFNGKVTFSNITGGDSIITTQNIQNAVNNNVSDISGNKITTGYIGVARLQSFSVTADKLAPSTGKSTVWSGGGLVSENFNGNHHGNIGSPTQGFRLSSNAVGTSADPNIYGAYIKASTMEFLYAGIPGTNNSGRFNYSSTASGGAAVMLVSPTYGSGYADNRITSLQNSILTIIVTIPYSIYSTMSTGGVTSTGYIQRSINSAGYTNIASQQANVEHGVAQGSTRVGGNFVITYVENLANLGNFNTLSYRASNGGTVMVTLNN
ncbi:hypothetical protein N5U04_09945 [Aliarcobacter butzleri]|uniref:hypothetical protein n=1 Tax=Aliarcobacter butzleri TaxID=28197 RepID=UPI0021B4CF24|nr:hypothetical protein [Aliarcobacter butzleri]MCT7549800.1 hypothetical protein [Aliarcobacter butzleri]MCT7559890.1 hypothetical protein [Aliarcobacter butzleri]